MAAERSTNSLDVKDGSMIEWTSFPPELFPRFAFRDAEKDVCDEALKLQHNRHHISTRILEDGQCQWTSIKSETPNLKHLETT